MGKETLVFVQAHGIELPKKNIMQNLGHMYIKTIRYLSQAQM